MAQALKEFVVFVGLGITLLLEDEVIEHIEAGHLVQLLQDWCPALAGYHLHYLSRWQPSPAFSLVEDALRCRGDSRRKDPSAASKRKAEPQTKAARALP